MSALVGVTTTTVAEPGNHGRGEVVLYTNYLDALEREGLTPVLISPAHSDRSVADLLRQCSGLVLSGGEDVDPARYGETPIPQLGAVNRARDAMEFAALRVALELGLPTLGICRGSQVMNVYFGGSLYQDLDRQRPGELRHRQQEPWGLRTHHARIEAGSQLWEEVGAEELLINSFHHQGIKVLAPPLRAVAVAEDGLVEAVELRARPWVIGVQWHPERHEATAPETDPDRRLLGGFADAVAARLLPR